MTLLAYRVPDDCSEFPGIVFAAEPPEFGERAPALDKYAPGPVTAAQFLAEGWWVSCSWCEHQIYEFGCGDCDGEIVCDGEWAWCNQECRDKEHAAHLRRREMRAECEAALRQRVPFATDIRTFIGGPGHCRCFSDNHYNAWAGFQFPGSRINHNSYCHGCKTLWVCKGDLEAFEKLREQA